MHGTWISDTDISSIKEIEEIIGKNRENKVYKYLSKDNYYEKKVSFKNQKELNSLIKSEIENLFSDE